jgi:serine/threonine-protein kinase
MAATASTSPDFLQTAVLDLRTGEHRTIVAGASSARYVPSGHVIFAAGGTLRAARFDLERLEILGEGVPVVEQLATKPTGAASVAVSANGTLVYLHGVASAASQRTLAWVDRQGREEPIPAPVRAYAYPRLSPDGTRIAVDIRDQENDTWIWDLARRTLTRLTFDPAMNRGVEWTSDGKRVAFSAQRDGGESVYWQAADGSGAPERLTEGQRPQVPSGFTPDGKFMLFQEPGAAPYDMFVLSLADRKIQPLLASPKFSERAGDVSPDGRWIAYQSNESGNEEVYVRPFPNVDAGRWQVSAGGGTRPKWGRDGKELFYLVAPDTIMTVPVDIAGATFSAANPVAAAKGAFLAPQDGRNYDVTADGRRFVVIKDAVQAATIPPQLVLVMNWTDELKRLVP